MWWERTKKDLRRNNTKHKGEVYEDGDMIYNLQGLRYRRNHYLFRSNMTEIAGISQAGPL